MDLRSLSFHDELAAANGASAPASLESTPNVAGLKQDGLFNNTPISDASGHVGDAFGSSSLSTPQSLLALKLPNSTSADGSAMLPFLDVEHVIPATRSAPLSAASLSPRVKKTPPLSVQSEPYPALGFRVLSDAQAALVGTRTDSKCSCGDRFAVGRCPVHEALPSFDFPLAASPIEPVSPDTQSEIWDASIGRRRVDAPRSNPGPGQARPWQTDAAERTETRRRSLSGATEKTSSVADISSIKSVLHGAAVADEFDTRVTQQSLMLPDVSLSPGSSGSASPRTDSGLASAVGPQSGKRRPTPLSPVPSGGFTKPKRSSSGSSLTSSTTAAREAVPLAVRLMRSQSQRNVHSAQSAPSSPSHAKDPRVRTLGQRSNSLRQRLVRGGRQLSGRSRWQNAAPVQAESSKPVPYQPAGGVGLEFPVVNPYEQVQQARARSRGQVEPNQLIPFDRYEFSSASDPFFGHTPHGMVTHEWQHTTCAVCYDSDSLVDMLLSPCNHVFHASCIVQWVERNFSCPLCRQPIELFIPAESISAADVSDDTSESARSAAAQRSHGGYKLAHIVEQEEDQDDADDLETFETHTRGLGAGRGRAPVHVPVQQEATTGALSPIHGGNARGKAVPAMPLLQAHQKEASFRIPGEASDEVMPVEEPAADAYITAVAQFPEVQNLLDPSVETILMPSPALVGLQLPPGNTRGRGAGDHTNASPAAKSMSSVLSPLSPHAFQLESGTPQTRRQQSNSIDSPDRESFDMTPNPSPMQRPVKSPALPPAAVLESDEEQPGKGQRKKVSAERDSARSPQGPTRGEVLLETPEAATSALGEPVGAAAVAVGGGVSRESVVATRSSMDRFTRVWEQHYYLRASDGDGGPAGAAPPDIGIAPGDYLDDTLKKERRQVVVLADVSDSIATIPPEQVTPDHLQLLRDTIDSVFLPRSRQDVYGESTSDPLEALGNSLPYIAHAAVLERILLNNVAHSIEQQQLERPELPLLAVEDSLELTSGESVEFELAMEHGARSWAMGVFDYANNRRVTHTSRGPAAAQRARSVPPGSGGAAPAAERASSWTALRSRQEQSYSSQRRAVGHDGDANSAAVRGSSRRRLTNVAVAGGVSGAALFSYLNVASFVTQYLHAHAPRLSLAGLGVQPVGPFAVSGATSRAAAAATSAAASAARVGPSRLLVVPTVGAFFIGYDMLKRELGVEPGREGPRGAAALGAGVAAVGGAAAANALQIYRSPGTMGLLPLQFGVQYAAFEQTKGVLADMHHSGDTSRLSGAEVFGAAAVGGVATSTVIHPLRAAQAQLQAIGGQAAAAKAGLGAGSGGSGSGSAVAGMKEVLQGKAAFQTKGLMTGVSHSMMRLTPVCIVTAVAYEHATRFQQAREESRRAPRMTHPPNRRQGQPRRQARPRPQPQPQPQPQPFNHTAPDGPPTMPGSAPW